MLPRLAVQIRLRHAARHSQQRLRRLRIAIVGEPEGSMCGLQQSDSEATTNVALVGSTSSDQASGYREVQPVLKRFSAVAWHGLEYRGRIRITISRSLKHAFAPSRSGMLGLLSCWLVASVSAIYLRLCVGPSAPYLCQRRFGTPHTTNARLLGRRHGERPGSASHSAECVWGGGGEGETMHRRLVSRVVAS